jgi:hypothetical protein
MLETLNSWWVGALIFGGIGWTISYKLDQRLKRQLVARQREQELGSADTPPEQDRA